MSRPWLGQVGLRGASRRPLLGASNGGDLLFCVNQQQNGSQIKYAFDLNCVNTWTSPEGIYPGVSECRPSDGKPTTCPPPPAPQMAGRGRRLRLGQASASCKIPGTETRPVFDTNFEGRGVCGAISTDTSNSALPDCVQAPAGYTGQPAAGNWIPASCGAGAPPAQAAPPAEVQAALPAPGPVAGIPVSNAGAPPTVNGTAPYEAGPPVLPPKQTQTTAAMPTGAFPGNPFPSRSPMKAIAPMPIPEACPLGPVPIAEWTKRCATSKLK